MQMQYKHMQKYDIHASSILNKIVHKIVFVVFD